MKRRLFAMGLPALLLGGVSLEAEARGKRGGGKGGRRAPGHSGGGGGGGCGSRGGAGFRKPNGKCADKNGR